MTRTLAEIHADMARLKAEKKRLRPRLFKPAGNRSFQPVDRNQRQPRERDNKHLAFIRRLPCAACGAPAPSDAAHLRAANHAMGKRYTGKAEKPSDKWTTPLCRDCHTHQHSGAELAFWSGLGIDPFTLCQRLYAASGDEESALSILALREGGAG